MAEVRTCEDCRFCLRDNRTWDKHSALKFAKCGRPRELENCSRYDLVTGIRADIYDALNYCSTERGFEFLCGRDARYFEGHLGVETLALLPAPIPETVPLWKRVWMKVLNG